MQRRVADQVAETEAAIHDAYIATDLLTIWEGLPGELLSGLECSKAQLVFVFSDEEPSNRLYTG